MLIVGTRAHLEDLDRSYTYAEDVAVTSLAVGTFFGGVGSLLPGGPRPTWALLDAERIVSLEEFDVAPLVRLPEAGARCMAAVQEGTLLVGLQDAHLVTVSQGGVVTPVASFDQVEGRDAWTNPAGPSPDVRSIASSESGWFVSVHVGGVWRSTDQGASWQCVIKPESDVHEIVAGDEGCLAVAAAAGFGWTKDGGDSWQWTSDGLHAGYARAVALDGDVAFLTASTGPETADGRLYRARMGEPFAQCSGGLPESFPFNLDTGSVTALGGHVALGTHSGQVYRSADGGSTWEIAAQRMKPVTAVRFS